MEVNIACHMVIKPPPKEILLFHLRLLLITGTGTNLQLLVDQDKDYKTWKRIFFFFVLKGGRGPSHAHMEQEQLGLVSQPLSHHTAIPTCKKNHPLACSSTW